jgi:glycosyltransferase involved in cell wall biosynthesis
MTRVLLCGTYPTQYNGYSKVVYELALELAKYPDIQLTIFGFQNYYNNTDHISERRLPSNVVVYDAWANENPKKKGFGEELIEDFVKINNPDVVMVYNDLVVLSAFLARLNRIPDRKFKILPYIDLVYKNEKNAMIRFVNDHCDGGVMFTEYWNKVIKHQKFTKPTWVMESGFNPYIYYPIDRRVARKYFGIEDSLFVITNLNRNQPRKRWDLCIMAFVQFISRHIGEPIRLLIATALQGGWDIMEIFYNECLKYGLNPDEAKKHLIFIQNPQQLTDKDINVLYSVADIGINTCEGEGFGLCNFEQAGVGVPQIVPWIGGFKDFFDKDCAMVIEPKYSYYVDSSRDAVGGEPEICDVDDYTNAMELYYANDELRREHGTRARKKILEQYKWAKFAGKLRTAVYGILGQPEPPVPTQAPPTLAVAAPPKPEEKQVPAVVELEKPDIRDLKTETHGNGLFKEIEEFKPEPTAEVPKAAEEPIAAVAEKAEKAEEANKANDDDDSDDDEELDLEMLMKLNKKITKILKKSKK